MSEQNFLVGQFEAKRAHLKAVAFRILGSPTEAEDAVQEAWLRLSRTETGEINNIGGWLTTVVSRVCLDLLRKKKSRREDLFGPDLPDAVANVQEAGRAEHDLILADSVGLALQVVLQTLSASERIAFVLHDMFDLPFDDIARVLDRTPMAARQIASRARRRVQGKAETTSPKQPTDHTVVEAFLAASRDGDMAGLLTVLDPDIVFRADAEAMRLGSADALRGAQAVGNAFLGRARSARPGLIDGGLGVVVAPSGKLLLVLEMVIIDGRITEISSIADHNHLRALDIAVLD